MRAVRLIRSGWWDDEVNGDPGKPLVLSDDKAESHVAAGNAVYDPVLQAELDGVPSPQTTFVGPEAAARRLDELTAQLTPVEQIEAGLADMRLPGEPAAELKRPYGNASKADWIAWAVHNGADEAEVAGWTKNQLMSSYGERL